VISSTESPWSKKVLVGFGNSAKSDIFSGSDFVKQSAAGGVLGEDTIKALLKYDYPTQDKLAKIVIGHQLTNWCGKI